MAKIGLDNLHELNGIRRRAQGLICRRDELAIQGCGNLRVTYAWQAEYLTTEEKTPQKLAFELHAKIQLRNSLRSRSML